MPPELPALVESVTFGTSGLRYRRTGTAAQVARLHDPVFVTARDGGTLVGAYVLDRRRLARFPKRADGESAEGAAGGAFLKGGTAGGALVEGGTAGGTFPEGGTAGDALEGVYRGLLCVAAGAEGQGVGRALAARGRRWIDDGARERGAPTLSWGCIDVDNHRSLTLLARAGARIAGGLSMFMLYRQWPRERVALEPLGATRDPHDERRALALAYADCAVRDVTPSRLPGFATIDAAGIRASARVAPSGYRIATMGRALDTLVRWTVTPFPPARRRFDPAAFRYVRLADVTLREGCERDWPAFVSTLLARHDAHFAMVFLDPTSRLHARLRRIGALAPLLHRPTPSLHVVARWSGVGGCAPPALPGGPWMLPPVDG